VVAGEVYNATDVARNGQIRVFDSYAFKNSRHSPQVSLRL